MNQEVQSFTSFLTTAEDGKITSSVRLDIDITNGTEGLPLKHVLSELSAEIAYVEESIGADTSGGGVKLGQLGETIRWTFSDRISIG